MSSDLWRFLLQNDVEGFRQYLASATYSSTASKSFSGSTGGPSFKIGSPGILATSPKTPTKSRKSAGNTFGTAPSRGGTILTRGDINARDAFGRTLLHHAASQDGKDAYEFVQALLQIPFVDLYAQDAESGWTALHRALYFGNISSAQALMQRDVRDAIDYTTTASHAHAGGLVKIKDNEGNSPFEVFGLSIAPRDIQSEQAMLGMGNGDSDSSHSVDLNVDEDDSERQRGGVEPSVDLHGDEVFVFGSNKNLTLGTGDENDRHYPERLYFERPEHLLVRLHEDHKAQRRKSMVVEDLSTSLHSLGILTQLPAPIINKPVTIQDVVMSKLHTAVMTNDPISNLYICGFGPGGRLGTGDESTCFKFKCILGGGLARRRVSSIALGQDHTIAICSQGEVFTWGSNRHGQLGYALPEVSSKETPMQLLPRQLYGYVKKELVIGAAASSIHSAIFTSTALYTFGKNEGQLGLTDADARSLEIQSIPRRVAPTVLQAGIRSVSAIDRATTVLLDNHEIVVFTHYGWTKILFQLGGLANDMISDTVATRYSKEGNVIRKITSGGHTICAMSSFGEVFTIEVPKVSDSVPSSMSTTNPAKARNALPHPVRVWSIRKAHMSAIDMAVGQDGSVILCTSSGSVWRKEKRANIKSVRLQNTGPKTKDYKFVRVPNLTRAVAVRSNAFGAFAAVRKDSEVTREQIAIQPPSMWSDLFQLLPFYKYGERTNDEVSDTPQLRFWTSPSQSHSPADVKRAIITRSQAEKDLQDICQRFEPLSDSSCDVWITSNVTDVRIPVHSFVLAGRSKVLRAALAEFQQTYFYGIPDVLNIEYGADGQIQMLFHGADFLTLANLVFYLYADEVADVWHHTSKALQSAARYRAVRVELMKIASSLELRQLERSARLMIDPSKSICSDLEVAFMDSDLFTDADVLVELADETEQHAHSILLCARCPFFDGLFNGRAGGKWMTSRRGVGEDGFEVMRVDLKHIDFRVFQLVLRHIYTDTGPELFDNIITQSFEEFAELVLDVMSAANELMIDRLAEICQCTLGKFITVKNVCWLLNVVSDCSVNEFKHAALEYICLNLETMLEQRLLEELDPELLAELDEVVQQNQLAYMPFARSNRARDELIDRHPDLISNIEQGRKRRIDSMRLRSRLVDDELRMESMERFRVGSYEKSGVSPRLQRRSSYGSQGDPSPRPSPAISPRDIKDELPFEMDEDATTGSLSSSAVSSPSLRAHPEPSDSRLPSSLSRQSDVSQNFGSNVGLNISSSLEAAPSMSTLGEPAVGSPKHAWKSSPLLSKKVDLKDIMEQASSSRVSGITQSLQDATTRSSRPTQKMSQKERKKQQQMTKVASPDVEASKDAALTANKPLPSSPWQNVAQQRKSSNTVVTLGKVREQSPNADSASRPSMTMRQTVAGAPPTSGSAQQMRSKSSPAIAPASKPAQPIVQSIRHTPAPVRSSSIDAHTSMADILAQQQTEKTAVKEAAVKRSLQEIQQEQEFQEWWDKESQRVQEEEAQAKAGTNRRGKSRRHRGGGQRGRGQAGVESSFQPSQPAASSKPVKPDQVSTRGSGESTRGSIRGRGRGRSQA